MNISQERAIFSISWPFGVGYEMGLPEDAHMKPPKGYNNPSEAFNTFNNGSFVKNQ
jgi:hypothetical protein